MDQGRCLTSNVEPDRVGFGVYREVFAGTTRVASIAESTKNGVVLVGATFSTVRVA